jgi:hypothetical protein
MKSQTYINLNLEWSCGMYLGQFIHFKKYFFEFGD